MEVFNPKEIKINIKKELEGELIDVDFNQIQELEGEFQKEVIREPEDLSFDRETKKVVLEGFTEGALKNILTLSKEKVRPYKVTKDSIELLSCSKPVKCTSIGTSESCFPDSASCSVQIFPFKGKTTGFILKFDSKTGELIEEQEFKFSDRRAKSGVSNLNISKPMNSRIDSYCTPGFSKKFSSFEISRVRRGRILRGLCFDRITKTLYNRQKKKFDRQVLKFLGELRLRLFFEKYLVRRVFGYSKKNPNLVLIVSKNKHVFFLFLVDLRRKKLLKTSTLSIIDLLGGPEGVEAVVYDDLQIDPDDEETVQRRLNIHQPLLYTTDFVFLPKSKSLIFLATIDEVNLTLKIPDVMNPASLSGLKIIKKRTFVQGQQILRKFGEDKVLMFYSGNVWSSFQRPLAWLDPETLEETKIEGFEGEEGSLMLFGMKNVTSQPSLTQLTKNRMLIVNDFFAFIFDFKEAKVIAEQRYCLQRIQWPRLVQIDNLYAIGNQKCVHLLETKKSHNTNTKEEEEVLSKVKTIHLDHLVPNLSFDDENSKFKFFQLRNGNYLYISRNGIGPAARRSQRNPDYKNCFSSVEIDRKTLTVVKSSLNYLQEILPNINLEQLQLIGDYLLVSTRLKKPQKTPGNQYSLALLSTDFQMLDYCSKSILIFYFVVLI